MSRQLKENKGDAAEGWDWGKMQFCDLGDSCGPGHWKCQTRSDLGAISNSTFACKSYAGPDAP
jgi:hypothetical protein